MPDSGRLLTFNERESLKRYAHPESKCEIPGKHAEKFLAMGSGRGRAKSIVQRLYEAGMPGSVHWIYDSAFGVTLRDKKGGVSSWAEAEAWFANAPPGV